MTDPENDETVEGGEPIEEGGEASKPPKERSLYDKALRTLEEHEFANPAAIQFMIDNIRRLEAENRSLVDYRSKFYRADSDLRVEKERSSLSNIAKNVSTLVLSASSAGVGIVASMMEISRVSVGLLSVFLAIAISTFFLRLKDKADA